MDNLFGFGNFREFSQHLAANSANLHIVFHFLKTFAEVVPATAQGTNSPVPQGGPPQIGAQPYGGPALRWDGARTVGPRLE